jgi:hypothetical protein
MNTLEILGVILSTFFITSFLYNQFLLAYPSNCNEKLSSFQSFLDQAFTEIETIKYALKVEDSKGQPPVELEKKHFQTDLLIDDIQKERYILVIGILSAPNNFERRDAVRSTWIKLLEPLTHSIHYKFLIGTFSDTSNWERKIQQEQEHYGDIVRLSVTEDYSKLLQKTLAVFKWATDSMEFDYLLKLDDDSFLRPELLLTELQQYNKKEQLYLGFMHQ